MTAGHSQSQVRRARSGLVELDDAPALSQFGESSARGNRDPVSRSDKVAKGTAQLGDRAPATVVVHLEIGDDGDLRIQLEEAGVALVRLGDDPLPPAPARVDRLRPE